MQMRQRRRRRERGQQQNASRGGKKMSDFGYPEVAFINDAIRKGWADHNLAPSKAATDGEWCRRVYLDLIGRMPTVEELTSVSRHEQDDKRAELVDRLLGDEYADEYARNWKTIWTNILIGRTGGTDRRVARGPRGDDGVSRRRRWRQQAVRRDGAELVTATGESADG